VEIGYDFRSDYWGQGLATEAAAAVRDFALDELGLPRVISLIRPENVASVRVSEKIGMAKEREIERGGATYWEFSLSRSEP
jgi:RimJ/RimL family protein N-acetyltransferase